MSEEASGNPERLSQEEGRVLGALIEKELTTPDQYPLSLNSLVNACNQKSSRDPVVELDHDTVEVAIESLRDERLAMRVDKSGSRVAHYRHNVEDRLRLLKEDRALLGLLLLRGPQTLGELRTRSQRAWTFTGLGEVEETLERLAERDRPLVEKLPPQPGRREARYQQLLAKAFPGEEVAQASSTLVALAEPAAPTWKAEVEARLKSVEARLAELEKGSGATSA